MTRLREPLSGPKTAAALLGIVVLISEQLWLGRHLRLFEWILLALLLEFVVQPISVLIRELGHALAVMRLTGRSSYVVVGRPPWAKFSIGQIAVSVSPLPLRNARTAGLCHWDPDGVAGPERARIALAGPLGTLVELLMLVALAPWLWRHGAFIRDALALTLAMLCVSILRNLPAHLAQPADATQLAPSFSEHSVGGLATVEQQHDRQREATSVPPPSYRP